MWYLNNTCCSDFELQEKKKIVSYDNRMCNAHLVSGRGAEYLQNLTTALESATTPETFGALSASFPRGGALGLLEKHPELQAQCK